MYLILYQESESTDKVRSAVKAAMAVHLGLSDDYTQNNDSNTSGTANTFTGFLQTEEPQELSQSELSQSHAAHTTPSAAENTAQFASVFSPLPYESHTMGSTFDSSEASISAGLGSQTTLSDMGLFQASGDLDMIMAIGFDSHIFMDTLEQSSTQDV